MRLNKYLTEKLNLNYKLKASNTYDTKGLYEVEFDVNGIEYTFSAWKFFLKDSPEMRDELGYDFVHDSEVEIWRVEFKQDTDVKKVDKGQYGVTGEQGIKALEVFSAVAMALKQFLNSRRPEYWSFSAQERSRVHLYSRFAKMITKLTGKYTVKEFTHKANKYWVFIRK